jgi:hypothetical protein
VVPVSGGPPEPGVGAGRAVLTHSSPTAVSLGPRASRTVTGSNCVTLLDAKHGAVWTLKVFYEVRGLQLVKESRREPLSLRFFAAVQLRR